MDVVPDAMDPSNPIVDNDSASLSSASSAEFDEILSRSRRRRLVAVMAGSIVSAAIEVAKGLYDKQEYHTSVLSGHAWVLELRSGHPDRIRCELGVSDHVFGLLLSNLSSIGYKDSRHVTLEEQLAIFLYTCVTGLSTRHVGERFQRANSTIAKCILKAVLCRLSHHLSWQILQDHAHCALFSPILRFTCPTAKDNRCYSLGDSRQSQAISLLQGCSWRDRWDAHHLLASRAGPSSREEPTRSPHTELSDGMQF